MDGIGNISKSRIKNSQLNILFGLIKQLIGIVLTFSVRTLLIYKLGVEYQGLNSLFSSILQILNLSDLGFSAAVTFILYKPIAEEKTDVINAIIALLRKVYRIVGLSLLILGFAVSSFLPSLISGEYPQEINIYLLFYIFLINSSISYFLFSYKNTLLTALQRDDLVSKAHLLSSVVMRIAQVFVLLYFKNFYIYAAAMILGSLFNNLLVQFFSRKYFPQFFPSGEVDSELSEELKKQVKAVFVNRLSDVARNCFDDVIVSCLFGLSLVAVYDNYYYVLTAVSGFMSIVAHGVRASVGNSIVTESVEKNYKDLRKFSFLFMWLAGWCTICLLCLYQPFMRLWLSNNEKTLFPDHIMVLFCVYFYVLCTTYTKNVYSEAKGLFWDCRYIYVIEAVANLALNIVLGLLLGIIGVLLATIITIVVINDILGTIILFKKYFGSGLKYFVFDHVLYICVTAIIGYGCYLFCSFVMLGGIVGFGLKVLFCSATPNLLFLLVYCRTNRFKECLPVIRKTIKRKTVV